MNKKYLLQITFLLLAIILFAGFAHADQCEDKILKGKDDQGQEWLGKLCSKDRYFVTGDGIESNTLMLIKGPYLRKGVIDENGQFEGKKSYSLRTVNGSPWCSYFGKKYLIKTTETDWIFGFSLLNSYGSALDGPLTIEPQPDHTYTTGIYCSDQFFSLETMALRRAVEKRGDTVYYDGSAEPIELKRQDK